MAVHGWVRNESTNQNQSYDSANSFEDLVCGGGLDCDPFQDIDFVVEGQHAGLACPPCYHYHRLASRVVEVGSEWCRQVGGMVMCQTTF